MRRALAAIVVCLALVACVSPQETAKRQRLSEIQTEIGLTYLKQGQLDLAHRALEKALAAKPDNPQANNVMALLQTRLHEFDKADRHFLRAIELDPRNSDFQNNYGVFLCAQGRWDDAVKYFRMAAANPLYRGRAMADTNAGLCLMKKPDTAAAARLFRDALDLDPQYPMALYQMARISYDAGRMLSARAYIERFFAVAPDAPEPLLLAVRIERALGNQNAEASYALRLHGKFPSSVEAQQLR